MTTYRDLLNERIADTLRSKNLGEEELDRWYFRQIFNFRYADKAQMMTVGWVVYQQRDLDSIDKCRFDMSRFYRNSQAPIDITIPNLTIREMRGLDRYLPHRKDDAGFKKIPVPVQEKELYHEIYRLFPAFTEADL